MSWIIPKTYSLPALSHEEIENRKADLLRGLNHQSKISEKNIPDGFNVVNLPNV